MSENIIFSEVDVGMPTQPIGVVVLTLGEGVHAAPLMQSLLVDTSVRRRGVGSRLIHRAEEKAKELGATRVFAVTHPDNLAVRALFHKLGYTEMILLEKKFDIPVIKVF